MHGPGKQHQERIQAREHIMIAPTQLQERASSRLWNSESGRRLDERSAARVAPWLSRPRLLHEGFEVQADQRPDGVAVALGQEKITYGQLERRANRFARYLSARGVQSGSLVAMLLPRSVDAYAVLLGILKAGAAYVPLDLEYPADRIAYILEDCGANTLVTTTELAKCHTAFRGPVVCVDAGRSALDAKSPARLPSNAVGVGPRDLCYVIYTSGSTGRPKGVMIEHRNACHLVCAEARIFPIRPEDRVRSEEHTSELQSRFGISY